LNTLETVGADIPARWAIPAIVRLGRGAWWFPHRQWSPRLPASTASFETFEIPAAPNQSELLWACVRSAQAD